MRFFRFLRSKLGRYLPTPPIKFSDGDRVALPINERNIWLGNGSRRITTPPYQVIQGIATHLVSRNLVLVTTENQILFSELLQKKLPLLPEAAKLIADPQVRNRGTIGGDIAHGDPANDHPAIAMALDATFVLQGPGGQRKVKAVDFFQGTYMTDMAEDEIMVSIEVAPFAPKTGYAYHKLKRKTGDWATAAAAVVIQLSGNKVSHVAIGLTNVAPTALRATAAEQLIIGQEISPSLMDQVAESVRSICDPAEDLRGDAEYKTAMAGEMTRRAIAAAIAHC